MTKKRSLLDHIQNSAAEQESQPLTAPLPPPPPAPRVDLVPLMTRITVANDRALDRAAFWLPANFTKQTLVNNALAYYLAQFPESSKPTPKEHTSE